MSDTLDFLERDRPSAARCSRPSSRNPSSPPGTTSRSSTPSPRRRHGTPSSGASRRVSLSSTPLAARHRVRYPRRVSRGRVLVALYDYRVQSLEGTFGLNEVKLGIPVPNTELFVATAGPPKESRYTAALYPPRARGRGSGTKSFRRRRRRQRRRAPWRRCSSADGARAATKLNLREAFSREWKGSSREARAGGETCEPDVEWALGGVLERLSSSSRRREGSGGGAETPTAKL